MGAEPDHLLESLMKWLDTFPVTAARDTIENVSDGVAMAEVLNLLAPEHFNSTWLSDVSHVGDSQDSGNHKRIKLLVSTDSKELKLSNLQKVLTGILNFLKDVPSV